jgi:preprotein translocase subunit SecG
VTLFIIFHVLICVFLVIVILLQPGKGDAGIGFGSSSSQSIFGSRGAGNFLTKTTSACAFIFLATSFVLTRSQIVSQAGIKIDTIPAAPAPVSKPADKAAPSGQPGATAPGDKAAAPSEPKAKTETPVKPEEKKK